MIIRSLAIAAMLALAIVPLAAGANGPPPEPGLPNACERSGNENPCRRIIDNTVIPPGKEKIYTGNYTAIGTVTVQGGGIATVIDANISFENTSQGFIAQTGAILRFIRSDLEEANGSSYGIDAQPGSDFTFNDSTLVGGDGVKVATSTVNMSGSTLSGTATALRLTDVTATIHHNAFLGNTVAVNQTGGVPTLSRNTFSGGEVCVQDWRTDPNILDNVFTGCHVGIYHAESHSVIRGNSMDDEAAPPGVGMWIINGNSPVIEDNVIRDYGTGIRITNARAFVRNNTVETSVGHGILVESNSGPMDVQGNLVRYNGGDGIHLANAADVPVFNNVVTDNGGAGIVVADSAFAFASGNVVARHPGVGIALTRSSDASIRDNAVTDNAIGIVVDAESPRALLDANSVSENAGAGIVIRADDVQVIGGSTTANGGHGIDIDHALDVSVAGLVANGNGGDGVRLAGSRATLDRVNASGNAGNGFLYDPMGPIELLGATELTSVRALFNGGSGLRNVDGNATSVHDAWWEGNAGAGVRNDDVVSVIDATECYWGSASGPTHPLNPLGTGDEVEGPVLYVPFLTAPPGEAPPSDASDPPAARAVGPYSLIPRGA